MIKFVIKRFSQKLNQNILYNPDKDFYKILNIKENSNDKEIKKSFYSLSIKHHPDKGGNEEDFKKISLAYDVMKSEEDRKIYDSLRNEYLNDLNKKINKDFNSGFNKTYENKNSYNSSTNNYSKNKNSYKNSYTNHKKYKKYESNFDDDYYQKEDSQDYKQNFKNEDNFEYEFNKRYKEFIEMMRRYQEELNKNNKDKSDNNFQKFKHNVKYTPLEKDIKFEDFNLQTFHRHHMKNRIDYFHKRKSQLSIFSIKQRNNLNPFEIFNEMNSDKDYVNSLNKLEMDQEQLDKRITLTELIKCYDKNIVIAFFILNFGILFYLLK